MTVSARALLRSGDFGLNEDVAHRFNIPDRVVDDRGCGTVRMKHSGTQMEHTQCRWLL